MRPTPLLGTAVALLLLPTTACTQQEDKSAEEIRDDLAASLEAGGLDEEAADCLAGLVIDEAGVDALRDVELSKQEPPAELAEDIAAATLRADTECEPEG